MTSEPKKEDVMKVFVECPSCHARVEVVVSNSVLLLLLAEKLGVAAVHVQPRQEIAS